MSFLPKTLLTDLTRQVAHEKGKQKLVRKSDPKLFKPPVTNAPENAFNYPNTAKRVAHLVEKGVSKDLAFVYEKVQEKDLGELPERGGPDSKSVDEPATSMFTRSKISSNDFNVVVPTIQQSVVIPFLSAFLRLSYHYFKHVLLIFQLILLINDF